MIQLKNLRFTGLNTFPLNNGLKKILKFWGGVQFVSPFYNPILKSNNENTQAIEPPTEILIFNIHNHSSYFKNLISTRGKKYKIPILANKENAKHSKFPSMQILNIMEIATFGNQNHINQQLKSKTYNYISKKRNKKT